MSGKTSKEKLMEQIAMLTEYKDVFHRETQSYDQEDDFSIAVSQVIMRCFVDNSKIKLGIPVCYQYFQKCAKVNKEKGSRLGFILNQIKNDLGINPIDNVCCIIRAYMRNMITVRLMQDASLNPQLTADYFDAEAFLMDGACR